MRELNEKDRPPPRPLMSRLLPLLVALLAAWSAADGLLAAEPTPADIARWIRELDSGKYVERELATEELLAAGRPALAPLAAALPAANLEVVSRITHILKTHAVEGEGPVQDEALALLEKLAENKSAAGRRAAAALAQLDSLRQTRAMAELRRMGAKFVDAPVQIAQNIKQDFPSIEIGDSWQGGEKGLAHLRWASEVNQVIFTGEKVRDEWLAHLKGMPELEYVKLKRTKITAAALGHLAAIEGLQQVNILYTPLDDGAIDAFKALKNLTDLRLYGTGVSEEGAAKLAAAMPGTSIDFKRGAFVGVGCDIATPYCLVQSVIEGAAAEKAGIEPGDIVVSYGGEPVTTFESLRILIQKNAAGQKVDMEIDRDGERLKKTLLLGEWE
jgi:hypothetical protein